LQTDSVFTGLIVVELNAGLLKDLLWMVEKFPFTTPSFCSIRWRVASPTPAARASLLWLQPRRALFVAFLLTQRRVRIFHHAGFIDHEPRAIGAGVDILDYRQPNKQRCRCLIRLARVVCPAEPKSCACEIRCRKVAVTDEIRRYFVSSA
jgi:hypothetical protein